MHDWAILGGVPHKLSPLAIRPPLRQHCQLGISIHTSYISIYLCMSQDHLLHPRAQSLLVIPTASLDRNNYILYSALQPALEQNDFAKHISEKGQRCYSLRLQDLGAVVS